MNSSSPALSEIEFTKHFPCTHCSPASMMWNLLLSIMSGILVMSGSLTARRQKRDMAASPSSRPSSMLKSSTCAPFST